MIPTKSPTFLSLAFLFLGSLYLAYLTTLPHNEVFFSGDGGLKYLMSQQFLYGNVSPALVLPVAPQAATLWDGGFYPFDHPFVYQVDGRRVPAFPLYFPLASAPFLAALGWRGLYILPAASVLFLWIWIARCTRALAFSTIALCAVLASVIFASPLTLYGAMYREHAPAVFLSAISLCLILPTPAGRSAASTSFVFGAFAGTAVFLRPEALVCTTSAIAISLICYKKERLDRAAVFAAGFFISVGAFLLLNRLIYGHVLGVHAVQVTDNIGAPSSLWFLKHAVSRLHVLLQLSYRYWPLCLFALAGVPLALLTSSARKRELGVCLSVLLLSLPLIALVVPNSGGKQWGPRYLLVLLPWASIMIGLEVEAVTQGYGRLVRGSAVLLLIVCLTMSLTVNMWTGTKQLAEDYRFRIAPVLEKIKNEPERIVFVTNQWIALELAAVATEKTFLWARSPREFYQAEAFLGQQGVRSILLVEYTEEVALPGIRSQEIGRSSSYVLRSVRIEESANNRG